MAYLELIGYDALISEDTQVVVAFNQRIEGTFKKCEERRRVLYQAVRRMLSIFSF